MMLIKMASTSRVRRFVDSCVATSASFLSFLLKYSMTRDGKRRCLEEVDEMSEVYGW